MFLRCPPELESAQLLVFILLVQYLYCAVCAAGNNGAHDKRTPLPENLSGANCLWKQNYRLNKSSVLFTREYTQTKKEHEMKADSSVSKKLFWPIFFHKNCVKLYSKWFLRDAMNTLFCRAITLKAHSSALDGLMSKISPVEVSWFHLSKLWCSQFNPIHSNRSNLDIFWFHETNPQQL